MQMKNSQLARNRVNYQNRADIYHLTSQTTQKLPYWEIFFSNNVTHFRCGLGQMKWIGLYATFEHIQAKLGQENLLRMVGWVRWHCPPGQTWGEYWTKVLEYKYKYLKEWRVQVQVQVLDFQKNLSTSTSTFKSTRVQVPSTLFINSDNLHEIY